MNIIRYSIRSFFTNKYYLIIRFASKRLFVATLLYHMVVLLSPTSYNSLQTQQNKFLWKVRNNAVQLMYRYLSTFPHIHYDKTMKDNVEDPGYSVFEERSQIMRITSSDGLEDLSAADKTEPAAFEAGGGHP